VERELAKTILRVGLSIATRRTCYRESFHAAPAAHLFGSHEHGLIAFTASWKPVISLFIETMK